MDFRESDHDILSFLEHLSDPNPQERNSFIDSLPKLREQEFTSSEHRDDKCPICQETFLSCIALEEMADAMETPAMSLYDYGVTRLPKCGHVFCRRDLSKWIIRAKKDTCPTCRTPIGLPELPTESPSATGHPFPTLDGDFVDIPGLGRQRQADLIAQLAAHFSGGNSGDSPYQHDDRSEFAGMYS